jgi:hypothetical protein
MVISEKTLKLSFVDFIKKKFKTRVIPYLFFNFILLVLSLFLQRDFPPFPLETVQDYFRTIGLLLSAYLFLIYQRGLLWLYLP